MNLFTLVDNLNSYVHKILEILQIDIKIKSSKRENN